MAEQLTRRLLGYLSEEEQNKYDPSDLLGFLNEGYSTVISEGIRLEINQPVRNGSSIRALDKLRGTNETTGLTFTSVRTYKKSTIDIDALSIEELLYIGGKIGIDTFLFSEIVSSKKKQLDWGLIYPTPQQGYFQYIMDSGVRKIEILVDKGVGSSLVVAMDYIETPTLISFNDSTLPQLPDRLIRAVVLQAATLAGAAKIRENTEFYNQLYQQEIRTHLW